MLPFKDFLDIADGLAQVRTAKKDQQVISRKQKEVNDILDENIAGVSPDQRDLNQAKLEKLWSELNKIG
jgi:hypothetical protein